jgi:hypothetical protein
MNLRTFIMGLLFESIGVFVLLYFSMMANFQSSNVLQWLGVALMMGGPLVFWEILPLWTEREGVEDAHDLINKEPANH